MPQLSDPEASGSPGTMQNLQFCSCNHGYEPQGKPWTQIPRQSSGVLYPPTFSGLFD
jgi:hypothetical protein